MKEIQRQECRQKRYAAPHAQLTVKDKRLVKNAEKLRSIERTLHVRTTLFYSMVLIDKFFWSPIMFLQWSLPGQQCPILSSLTGSWVRHCPLQSEVVSSLFHHCLCDLQPPHFILLHTSHFLWKCVRGYSFHLSHIKCSGKLSEFKLCRLDGSTSSAGKGMSFFSVPLWLTHVSDIYTIIGSQL